jgi:protein-disulfide isomerase
MSTKEKKSALIVAAVLGVLILICGPMSLVATGAAGMFFYGLNLSLEEQRIAEEHYTEPAAVSPPSVSPPSTPTPSNATPAVAVQRDSREPTIAGKQVEIEVVQFSDFQCGYCADRFQELHELTERHDWLQLQFKHYPLSNQCNQNVSSDMHENACVAAKAAECAHQQGLFWELGAEMFADQAGLSEHTLADKAGAAGLDRARYQACMQSAPSPRIQSDINSGVAMGIRGTPAMYALVLSTGKWFKITGDLEQTLQDLRGQPQ